MKLYFDIEYNRNENKDKNSNGLVELLIEIFVDYCNTTFGIKCCSNDVIILNSSNDVKVSYHLVFKTVVFENNIKCKNFIQHVIENLSPENLEMLNAFDMKLERKLIIDMSVYNKNQNFRILQSSKFGKNTPLELLNNDEISMSIFFETLISDQLLIVNTNSSEFKQNVPEFAYKKTNEPKKENPSVISKWPIIDRFVENLIGDGKIIKTLTFKNKEHTAKQIILYNIKDFRYCENIKRAHKKNTIYYIANVQRMIVYQRCHKCTGFRGKDISVVL